MRAVLLQQILLNQPEARLMQLIDDLQLLRLIRRLQLEILRRREERAMETFNMLGAHRDRTDNEPRHEWQPVHDLRGDFHHGGASAPRQGGRGDEPLHARAIEENVPRHGVDAGVDAARPGSDESPVQSANRRASFERLRPEPFDI